MRFEMLILKNGVRKLSFLVLLMGLCSFHQDEIKGFAGRGSIVATFHNEPQFEEPVSQLATENQFYSPRFQHWCNELHHPFMMHRKLWEFCYVLEVLNNLQMLQPGKTALGFGVGHEPLPALFAKYGIRVLASDQDFRSAVQQGWAASNQHASEKQSLNSQQICDQNQFNELVNLATVDMNHIPSTLYNAFDFVWSCCSFEHLGSLEAGLTFVKNSVKCLKPGGIAVHTTEFNLSSNNQTIQTGGTVIYRRQDILKLASELAEMGYEVMELNFHRGNGHLDSYVDVPPYKSDPHIKLNLSGYECTSMGIVIRRPL